MQDNELGPWMASHHPVPRLLQLLVAGKVFTVKGPIGMRTQFLIPFVEAIRGQKECLGIRRVNTDRHAMSTGGFPHRVEAGVINFYQRPACDTLAQIETESF
jgi:hypothetical protein